MYRYLLALTLAFIACGGSGDGGGGDVIVLPDSVVTPDVTKTPLVFGDPVPVDWQHTYGYYDSNGSSRDKEAIVGLASAADGTLYALSDRRYGSDPDGDDLVLLTVDPAGALTDKKLLRFGEGTTALGFARAQSGAFVLALEGSDLSIIAADAAGEPTWSTRYDVEPYAFGGLGLQELVVDEAGNIYFVGSYNPSTVSLGERGYVAKLDSGGKPLWMRSWEHASFFKRMRLAVTSGAVYVTDRVEGLEMSNPIVVAFTLGGDTLGQRHLSYEAFDGRRPAVTSAAVIANGSGVTLIGGRGTATDGDHNLYVYRMEFDDKLELVSHTASKLPAEKGVSASAMRLVRSDADTVRAITQLHLDGSYAVLDFTKENPVASAYDLIRGDTTSPFLEDDDFPILMAPGPAGTVYVAATADAPGPITLRPRTSVAISLPLDLLDAKLTIYEDTVVTEAGDTYTVAVDDKGVLDDPQADDEDAILLKVTLP